MPNLSIPGAQPSAPSPAATTTAPSSAPSAPTQSFQTKTFDTSKFAAQAEAMKNIPGGGPPQLTPPPQERSEQSDAPVDDFESFERNVQLEGENNDAAEDNAANAETATNTDAATDDVTIGDLADDDATDAANAENETQAQPADPAQPNTQARDYSKYDPEVAEVLRKLPNGTFAKFANKIEAWKKGAAQVEELRTQLKTAKESKPGFLAEHPESYRLDDSYKSAVQEYRLSDQETSFWASQLEKIAQGEAWQDFRGYDANGQPVIAEVAAPTNGMVDIRAQTRAQMQLNQAHMRSEQHKQNAINIKRNWTQYQKDAQAERAEKMAKMFKGTTPETLKPDDKKHYDAFIKALPAVDQSSPLAPAAGLMFVTIRKLAAKLQAQAKPARPNPASVPRNGLANGRGGAASTIIDLDKEFGPN